MTLAISEQTVIITGAGRGLGAAIAAAFARQGAKVAINYRNSRIEAEALAAELAKGATLPEAVAEAKSYLAYAVAHADTLSVGSGHGPVQHFHELWKLREGHSR